MSQIYWLASYPKSGNTWFRVFLTNLLSNHDCPANINELDKIPIASSRTVFDRAVGYDAGDLTHDEVDLLRPDVYSHVATQSTEPIYQKTHDAYTYLPNGKTLFPTQATAGVIYILRNPLDICVSFAHHKGTENIDSIIQRMADDNYAFAYKSSRQHQQLRQKLLNWSNHVLSWIDAPHINQHVMRYEDMKRQPEKTFAKAAAFLGLPHNTNQIRKAVLHSSFKELRDQETKQGFREKYPASTSFFRKGEIGSWRKTLTDLHVERIISVHKNVMLRFGYLNKTGEPTF